MTRPPGTLAGEHWRMLGAGTAVLLSVTGLAGSAAGTPLVLSLMCAAGAVLAWWHGTILGRIADALAASRKQQGHER